MAQIENTTAAEVSAGESDSAEPPPVTLGIDIGGTKIAFGLVDDANPTHALVHRRIPSYAEDTTIHQALAQAASLSLDLAKELGVTIARIGIGSPGVVDSTRGIVVSASPTVVDWAGTDLFDIVSRTIADVPISIHNDVRVWAFGEHRLGAGRALGDARTLYVSLGTGIGGAIVDHNMLLDSPRGTAGEINELLTVDFRGRADRAENIASGESLARYYNELRDNPDIGRIPWRERRSTDIDLSEVLRRRDAGDNLAIDIISGNISGLGAAIGGVARAFDISAIVLGGGVANIGDFVLDYFQAGLNAWLPTDNPEIRVVKSAFGSSDAPAAVLAAAEYARHASACRRSAADTVIK